jgi:hypothetical protein
LRGLGLKQWEAEGEAKLHECISLQTVSDTLTMIRSSCILPLEVSCRVRSLEPLRWTFDELQDSRVYPALKLNGPPPRAAVAAGGLNRIFS